MLLPTQCHRRERWLSLFSGAKGYAVAATRSRACLAFPIRSTFNRAYAIDFDSDNGNESLERRKRLGTSFRSCHFYAAILEMLLPQRLYRNHCAISNGNVDFIPYSRRGARLDSWYNSTTKNPCGIIFDSLGSSRFVKVKWRKKKRYLKTLASNFLHRFAKGDTTGDNQVCATMHAAALIVFSAGMGTGSLPKTREPPVYYTLKATGRENIVTANTMGIS